MALMGVPMLLRNLSKSCEVVIELNSILIANNWFMNLLIMNIKFIFYRINVLLHSFGFFLSRARLLQHPNKFSLVKPWHNLVDIWVHLSVPHIVDSRLDISWRTLGAHDIGRPVFFIFSTSWWKPLTLKIISLDSILIRIDVGLKHFDEKWILDERTAVLLVFIFLHQIYQF